VFGWGTNEGGDLNRSQDLLFRRSIPR